MGDENDSGKKSVKDAQKVTSEGVLSRAGEHNANCERDQRQVCCPWILYIEDDTVGQDSEQGREPFDCVDQGHGDFRGSIGAEKMTEDLESGEWQCCCNDIARWIPERVLEGGDSRSYPWEGRCQP